MVAVGRNPEKVFSIRFAIGNLSCFAATNARHLVPTPPPMKSTFKKSVAALLVSGALLFSAGCTRDDGKTTGQTIDDSAINAKVKAAFAKDPGVRAVDVKVATHLGAVQLSGWADSPEEKARAEELAKAVPGVKTVDNKIELKTSTKKP